VFDVCGQVPQQLQSTGACLAQHWNQPKTSGTLLRAMAHSDESVFSPCAGQSQAAPSLKEGHSTERVLGAHKQERLAETAANTMDWSTCCSLLGVRTAHTGQELRAAYKTLALRHHPDTDNKGGKLFQELQHAYSFLTDPAKRRAHHHALDAADPVAEGDDFFYDDEVMSYFFRRGEGGPACDCFRCRERKQFSEEMGKKSCHACSQRGHWVRKCERCLVYWCSEQCEAKAQHAVPQDCEVVERARAQSFVPASTSASAASKSSKSKKRKQQKKNKKAALNGSSIDAGAVVSQLLAPDDQGEDGGGEEAAMRAQEEEQQEEERQQRELKVSRRDHLVTSPSFVHKFQAQTEHVARQLAAELDAVRFVFCCCFSGLTKSRWKGRMCSIGTSSSMLSSQLAARARSRVR
jgi:curved DNA-binding protein CbpA